MDGNKVLKRKYWKGKLVSESVYNKRLKQSENGKKRRKQVDMSNVEVNDSDPTSSNFPATGCRIFNVEYFTKSMFCKFCEKPLQLINMTKEIQRGLASVFQKKCEECLLINDVLTNPTHINTEGTKLKHDINSQHKENGVPQVIKTKKIMKIILDHCQKVISLK